jgi:hypothetical protein
MQTCPALALAVLVALSGAATADPAKLTLEQLTARAQQGPRARMARSDTDAAQARTRELSAALLPRITLDGFITPGPRIDCLDPACTTTDPDGPAWDWKGYRPASSSTSRCATPACFPIW